MKSLARAGVLTSVLLVLSSHSLLFAQTTSATISGRITDPQGAVVRDAVVAAVNVDTGVTVQTKSNGAGIYVVNGLTPGRYRVTVTKEGFGAVNLTGLELNLQDQVSRNFELRVGSANESVTVEASGSNINTTDASVSTVVDQTYVKNMPLNGRSFQDLILLTPGIVTQTSQSAVNFNAGLGATGEFSVNGQRPEENYYTVDGVSGNVGTTLAFTGLSGSTPAATALGTTQALVSVDDLQEFRVQSSTYSAEYGRNPGGQFAFETKSGNNQWHGTTYDYLRNDFFDANDWFNNYLGVKEPPLRQNDFGGTFGGPIEIPHLYNGKDKTFFFVSYEGLRLIQPQAASVNGVPDLCLRGEVASCTGTNTPAPPALQPALKAFPLPNGQDFGDGWAQFTGSWSNPSSLDSTSIRFDHNVTDKLRLFFRFGDTGSSVASRGTAVNGCCFTPSMNITSAFTLRTYTAGATSIFTSRLNNEFRFNYSSNETSRNEVIGAFGGSTPVNLAQLTGLGPGSFIALTPCYDAFCLNLEQRRSTAAQRQWNLTDSVSLSLGRHQFKFGADYRRLTPFATQATPFLFYVYFDEGSIETNSPGFVGVVALGSAYPLYRNFSAFAQDEWRVSQRVSLSLGLRWEVNPPPGVTQGVMPYTVQGSSPDTWAVAPQGTPLWHTAWFNFAPRLGVAYVIRDIQGWETVVRGGGGLFFDTGQQLGSLGFTGPGFVAQNFNESPPFPTPPSIPAITNPPACCPYQGEPVGFPKHLQLPYTLQWNASIEQALGKSQAVTISYVGSHAARLLRNDLINTPNNANLVPQFEFIDNGLTSDYHSAQVQFRRRLSAGLTSLASYTWSHCIDYGSQNYNFGYQRENCDFDVRHNFSGAFSYDLPNAGHNRFLNAVLHHWGLDDRFTARSGFPITLNGPTFIDPVTGKLLQAGLDLLPGQPIYLFGANCASVLQGLGELAPGQGCPGGRAINASAFANVPVDPNGNPTRLGTSPRNFVRGFGAWQMDLAVRREFPIHERLKLQFRAEAFNVFNHPNFGTINPNFCPPGPGCNFGQATGTLANSLGILSPLYQMGGARSMQYALKLVF